MHELSIALSIIDMAAEEAGRRGVKVAAVHLKLGPLSGVAREAMLSAYGLACEGSALEGSQLLILDVPLIVHCPRCRRDTPPVSVQELCCPACGTPTPDVIHGRELEVSALEVVDALANAPG